MHFKLNNETKIFVVTYANHTLEESEKTLKTMNASLVTETYDFSNNDYP